jgi:hypothetical protein
MNVALFYLFIPPCLSSPFRYVVVQEVPHCCLCPPPLGNLTFYEDILVVGTYKQKQHPDTSLQRLAINEFYHL